MQRRDVLGSLAGIGAAAILAGVALAAASRAGDAGAPPAADAADGPPDIGLSGALPPALLGRLPAELGLSSQQRHSVRALLDQARPGFAQLRGQMQAGAELLARTAPDDPAYPSVVASVSQSAGNLAAQFVRQASALRAQLHAVLTPEQRARLAALEPGRYARGLEQRRRGRPDDRPPDRGGAARDPE